MNGIYLLLGTNLGDRISYLRASERELIASQIDIIEESSIYETAPWGVTDQPWFLNMVLEISTTLDPLELLKKTQEIERNLGRKREQKWGERSIDIDILFFNDVVLEDPDLKIPHPEIPNRKFTLLPLVELASFQKHPVTGLTNFELLSQCTDQLVCHQTDLTL